MLGPFELSLHKVLRIAAFFVVYSGSMRERDFDYRPLIAASYLNKIVDKQQGFFDWKFAGRSWAPLQSGILVGLLILTKHQEVSEPRDRIYSILGMVQWAYGSVPSLLVPDYTKSITDVDRDATRYTLKEPGLGFVALREVRHARAPRLSAVDPPSWVPDWNCGIKSVRMYGNRPLAKLCKAHGDTKTVITRVTEAEPNVLQVQGITIGTVREIGVYLGGANSDVQRNSAKVSHLINDIKAHLPVDSNTDDGSYDLASFLIADWCKDRWSKEQTIMTFNAYNSHITQPDGQPDLSVLCSKEVTGGSQDVPAYVDGLKRAWSYQRPLYTTFGHVGIGWGLVKPVDVLAILYGEHTPVILRVYGKYHQYIGDAYVYSIMNGEAVQQHQAEGQASETFTLR